MGLKTVIDLLLLLVGLIAGFSYQFGIAFAAGYFGWSFWAVVAWAAFISLHQSVIKPGSYSQQRLLGLLAGHDSQKKRVLSGIATGLLFSTAWITAISTPIFFVAAWIAG